MSTKRAEPAAPESPALDRRAFLGSVGIATGAVMAASVVPLFVARAASFEAAAAAPEPSRPGTADSPDDLWDIDDMWGHRPRYAHPIPYAQAAPTTAMWEQVDPVDRMLVA